MGKTWAATYNPPDDAASWAKSFLYGSLLVALLASVSGLLQLKLLSPAVGEDISLTAAEANDARQAMIGLLQIGPANGHVVPGVLEAARQHGLKVDRLTARESTASSR